MFSRAKSAVRFFIIGFAAGVLLAPREGRLTRQLLADKFTNLRQDIEDLATVAMPEDGFSTIGKMRVLRGVSATAVDKAANADSEPEPDVKPVRKRSTRRSRAAST